MNYSPTGYLKSLELNAIQVQARKHYTELYVQLQFRFIL